MDEHPLAAVIREELKRRTIPAHPVFGGGLGLTEHDLAEAVVESDWLREAKAEAWDEGHQHRQRRGPDECQCFAYSESECGCGLYGTGRLVSLDANPYRDTRENALRAIAPEWYTPEDF